MQRYFGIKKDKSIIYLNENDYHHIKNVIKHNVDDEMIVNIDNKSYLCKLNNDFKSVTIIKEEKVIDNTNVILYVPILSDNKMSLIIEKATELGVKEITPIMLEKCKFSIAKDKQSKKIDRWNKIALAASMQCGRINIPKINNIILLKDIKCEKYNIICSLDTENVNKIGEVLKNCKPCDIIQVVFGPEGGFSLDEEEYLVKKGFTKTTLGSRILRTETVPMVVLSIINYILDRE